MDVAARSVGPLGRLHMGQPSIHVNDAEAHAAGGILGMSRKGQHKPVQGGTSSAQGHGQGVSSPNPVRPSETTDFIRCARYWFYRHVEGWEAPPSAWTPEKLMGTAIHAGLAGHWRRHLQPKVLLTQAFQDGWPSTAPAEYADDGLLSLALKVLDKVLTWIAINMPDAQPVMVEEPLGQDGYTTPDLVTIEEGDILTVTDWKTSWNLDADRVRYRLEGLDRTHQFLHYAWAVGERLGRPVQRIRKVVIVGSPRIIVRDATWSPTPQALEYWLTSARQTWQDMAQVRVGERVATMNTNGCALYGPKYPCTYWEACFTCHGNREQMAQFLVREPR